MAVQVYALYYPSGVSMFLGEEGHIGTLVSGLEGQRASNNGAVERLEKKSHYAISCLPSREFLNEYLGLMASKHGVSGFFNVIASSGVLPAGESVSYFTNAYASGDLRSGQSHVGWFGYFKSDANSSQLIYNAFLEKVNATIPVVTD